MEMKLKVIWKKMSLWLLLATVWVFFINYLNPDEELGMLLSIIYGSISWILINPVKTIYNW